MWSSRVSAVRPCIRLTRSFDERSHSYLGYMLRIKGILGGEARQFLVAVGETALYKTSGLKVVIDAEGETPIGPRRWTRQKTAPI